MVLMEDELMLLQFFGRLSHHRLVRSASASKDPDLRLDSGLRLPYVHIRVYKYIKSFRKYQDIAVRARTGVRLSVNTCIQM
jgi:hypothetical protein